nr:hypothetical protein [Bacteroides sp. 51]
MDQFLAKLPYRYSNAGQDSLAKTIILDTAWVGTLNFGHTEQQTHAAGRTYSGQPRTAAQTRRTPPYWKTMSPTRSTSRCLHCSNARHCGSGSRRQGSADPIAERNWGFDPDRRHWKR